MNNQTIEQLEKDIERLHNAIDIISRYESSDNIHLKSTIRKEIDKLEKEIDELSR